MRRRHNDAHEETRYCPFVPETKSMLLTISYVTYKLPKLQIHGVTYKCTWRTGNPTKGLVIGLGIPLFFSRLLSDSIRGCVPTSEGRKEDS